MEIEMCAARYVSSMLSAIGLFLGATSDLQAHHLGYAHAALGSQRNEDTSFAVCFSLSPSKDYYWKSFEKREQVRCPRWRRVMIDAMRKARASPHD
jgi:hypothetical protein